MSIKANTSSAKLAVLLDGKYDQLLASLITLAPQEYQREWSAIELDGIIHTDSRCYFIDNFDNIHYNSRIRPDNLRKLTLNKMLGVEEHCTYCYKSYLEGGFNHTYLFKAYKSILESYSALSSSQYSIAIASIITGELNEYFTPELRSEILRYYKLKGLVRLTNYSNLCFTPLPLNIKLVDYGNVYPLSSPALLTPSSNISDYSTLLNLINLPALLINLGDISLNEPQIEIFNILLSDIYPVKDSNVIKDLAYSSFLLG